MNQVSAAAGERPGCQTPGPRAAARAAAPTQWPLLSLAAAAGRSAATCCQCIMLSVVGVTVTVMTRSRAPGPGPGRGRRAGPDFDSGVGVTQAVVT